MFVLIPLPNKTYFSLVAEWEFSSDFVWDDPTNDGYQGLPKFIDIHRLIVESTGGFQLWDLQRQTRSPDYFGAIAG